MGKNRTINLIQIVKTALYYILGLLIGIGLAAGFFYLTPVSVNALLNDESQTQFAVDNNLQQINRQISNSRHNAITTAIKEVSPAVVGINVIHMREYVYRSPFYNDPFFRHFFPDQVLKEKVENLGSGFIVSPDGYVLTNDHVVHGADQVVVTLTNGNKYDAEIVGFDYESDVALLKIDGKNLPFIRLGNSDDVIIGEWAIAVGNPFGLFSIHDQPTVTVGVVSATDRDFNRNQDGRIYTDMIQTDAAINRGNSGGPLVNSIGELIGMNTMIFTESGGSIGLGFAIPANRLKTAFNELKDRGEIDRDFSIGLQIQNVNRLVAMSLRLPELRGVVITDVLQGSSAEKGGLEPTDVIYGVNGQKINNGRDLEQIVRNLDLRVGDELKFDIFRDGKILDVTITLEKKD